MKKWIILLVCAALLIAVVVASIAVVSAQSDAETENSAEESENTQSESTQLENQSEGSESADESGSASSEDESVAEPIDAPEVVTLSYMFELTGTEKSNSESVGAELLEAALDLYAGQNVKYRVQFYMSFWEEKTIQVAFYRDLADGSFGTVYAWTGITLDVEGYPEYLYADLTEADLRTVLAYGKTTAWLIDEFPEAESIRPATEVYSHFKSAT